MREGLQAVSLRGVAVLGRSMANWEPTPAVKEGTEVGCRAAKQVG